MSSNLEKENTNEGPSFLDSIKIQDDLMIAASRSINRPGELDADLLAQWNSQPYSEVFRQCWAEIVAMPETKEYILTRKNEFAEDGPISSTKACRKKILSGDFFGYDYLQKIQTLLDEKIAEKNRQASENNKAA